LTTIIELISASCTENSNRPALIQKEHGVWQETDYKHLWDQTEMIAAGLIKNGMRPGNRVALLAPSSTLWVTAYLAILKGGGVAVPVDKDLKSAELRHVLNDCGAGFIFTETAYMESIIELAPHLSELEKVILLNDSQGPTGTISTEATNLLLDLNKCWHELVEELNIPTDKTTELEKLARKTFESLTATTANDNKKNDKAPSSFIFNSSATHNQWVRKGRILSVQDLLKNDLPKNWPIRRADETAIILYTSGTTGQSKGAMLSNDNIVSNIMAAKNHFKLDNSMATLSFLPINHVFEQVCGVLLPLSLGGKVTFAESLKKIGENLFEIKPTFLLGVPAVFRLFLDRIRRNIQSKTVSRIMYGLPFSNTIVRKKVQQSFGEGTVFVSGGAALDPAVASGLQEFGLTIYQGYGITETSPVIAAESPTRTCAGSVGIPVEHVQVRIEDPNSEGVGEIVVKGPNIMQGYYKHPKATAEVLKDNWYYTGDLGRMDSEGNLFISGRVKNLIVTPNGKNVYPEEIENELMNSPYIAEAMVYGHKVDAHAEEVYAAIYPDPDALEKYKQEHGNKPLTSELIESIIRDEVLAAGKMLADYKRIKKFTLRDEEFPKTTTRKIKRFAVEAEISAGD
jgi:long-chain acyl-CoA synthetase